MPYRSRTEITPAKTEKVTLASVAPDPLPDPPITWPPVTRNLLIPEVKTLKEKISDERWSNDRRVWKNCEHYKCSPVSEPDTGSHTFVENANQSPFWYAGSAKSVYLRSRLYFYNGSSTDPYGLPGEPFVGLPSFDQPNLVDGTFIPKPSNLDNLNQMALKTMLPKIKEDLSLLNSLYELKDFKSLPGLVKKFREVVPFIRNSIKNSKNVLNVFADFMRLPAETYLTYQFAIEPLLNDICGVYSALTSYQAKVNDLLTREGKMQTRHFQYNWNEYPAVTIEQSTQGLLDQPGNLIGDPAYTWVVERKALTAASEFHAQIQYNYNYTEYQRNNALVLALLDRLGINLNGQILWNAIPWSFVVDWVIDVNRFLGEYAKRQNMEPVINIHQYLWSIKRQRYTQLTMVCKTAHPAVVPPVYVSGSRIPHPVIKETAYRRQVGAPDPASLTSSGLSLREFSLGTALAIVQRKYRGVRRIVAPKPRL